MIIRQVVFFLYVQNRCHSFVEYLWLPNDLWQLIPPLA
ncbi:hypothetical protein SLEP1_g36975 [Rubroshorea leprosula]|uniref:Uncharacterized protein n=1 Tax=Rubroshorea leprosula TaxID=152421 RepID=A0AAV5KT94_9ROSI|nr:hypothetical protein SLEP1_g36975 [Rubroshorea leprosula]